MNYIEPYDLAVLKAGKKNVTNLQIRKSAVFVSQLGVSRAWITMVMRGLK